MIEVITFADITLRINSVDDYEQQVIHLLPSSSSKLETLEIHKVEAPKKNIFNSTYETNLYCKLLLKIPEVSKKDKVEDYIDEIVPFLQLHLKNCNRVNHIKIIQMKRMVKNDEVKEHLVKFN